MDLSLFDYDLPPSLIATHPVRPRDAARMMVVKRSTGKVEDATFSDLPELLGPGDVLVFNQTKVIPGRLRGEGNGLDFEFLLVRELRENEWLALAKPGKKITPPMTVQFGKSLQAEVKEKFSDGTVRIIFPPGLNLEKTLQKIGEVPLPPYILKERPSHRDEISDREDYQTVFAKNPGSIAAPTAGLHFSPELLTRLSDKGVGMEFVDLSVGLGTFEPIRTAKVEAHQIHTETFELTEETATHLNEVRQSGGRIIAVGTTTVRVLESCQERGVLIPRKGETDIYIYPGYRFGFVDGMITNFHLPKSSLLLLVSAFYDRGKILDLYRYAISQKYRFYSYGDGMFLY